MRKNLYSISWIRALAVVFILTCHLVAESPNVYVQMLGQFFNVGVNIFILISGVLFGGKEISNVKQWYEKRFERIYIPLWVFLSILAIFSLFRHIDMPISNWVLAVLGVQGSVVGVWGADHTWYISVILMCYLITPFIGKIINRVEKNTLTRDFSYVILAVLPVVFALLKSPAFYTLLSPIVLYIFGYILGRNINFTRSYGKSVIYVILVIVMFGIRIGSKLMFDGSILYDRIAVFYTQSLIAVFMLLWFINVFKNKKTVKIVECIDKYSYEIYLVHYMFIVGPVSLMHITESWIVNIAVTLIATCITAFCVNKVSNKLIK